MRALLFSPPDLVLPAPALVRALPEGGLVRIIPIFNNKGGVGKSTTAVNLGVALAQRKKRVLLIDYDAQANATAFLGLSEQAVGEGAYTAIDLTRSQRPFAPIRDVFVPGLDVVPSRLELGELEPELRSLGEYQGVRQLKQALARAAKGYDFVLIDCPPALDFLALSALAAGTEVLVPFRMEPASLIGAQNVLAVAQGRVGDLNPDLKLLGVLPTCYQEVGHMSKKVLDYAEQIYGKSALFKTVIHDGQAIASTVEDCVPIIVKDPAHRGAEEYTALAREVLRRA